MTPLKSIGKILPGLLSEYPDDIIEMFTSQFSVRHFTRKETIKKANTKEHYINIIEKGSVGLFINNGKADICINLFYEQDFFCDYHSILKQERSPSKTIALENLTLWSVPYRAISDLYPHSIASVQIVKAIVEFFYIRKHESQINLLTLTAAQRYEKMLAERPDILTRTPLKIIASYLGVTPESLSRLRKTSTIKQAPNHDI